MKIFFYQHRKGFILLGALFLTIMIVEALLFNDWFFISKLFRLTERHLSISDGSLYQFKYDNGTLVAQTNDPNITFHNLNLPIAAISIGCSNSIPGAVGQLFYSKSGEPFNEAESIRYNVALLRNPLYLNKINGFPEVMTISDLRFDLTGIPSDIVTCSELVINPNIPFVLSPLRLAVYLGLFLFCLSLIFRNSYPIYYLWPRLSILTIIFLFLVVLLSVKLIPVSIQQNLLIIVVLCILLFSGTITYTLAYLSSNSHEEGKGSFLRRYKYEIALIAIIIVTTLPLLTQSYYYYDDWWGIGTGRTALSADHLLKFGRPIHILFFEMLDPISIRNAYLFKWAFLPFMILYSCLLYRWLSIKTGNHELSFLVAGVLSIFPPVMDVLGYTSTSPFSFSILCSTLSVLCFDRAFSSLEPNKKLKFALNAFLSLLFLFEALLTYQVGPQIVFVIISIEIYFNLQKQLLFKNLLYLPVFALAHGFYLLSINLLNNIYQVELYSNRAEIIRSLSQISEKVILYKSVFEQSIMQVIAAFTDSNLFFQRYRGYVLTFTDRQIGLFLFLFVVIIILIAFINYWHRTKNIIGLLSIIVFVPSSYFVFLVLSNNGYLTYYAFAHISLLMFYFLMGLFILSRFIWKSITNLQKVDRITKKQFSPAFILAPVLIICALISNYYIRDFYIGYNSLVYQYIKNSLVTGLKKGSIERIHIIGLISPINADIYSLFVTEKALSDLGVNIADYKVTVSANQYYPERLEESVYLDIRKRLSEDDQQKLDMSYYFEPTYRQYYVSKMLSEEDKAELQRIFILTDVIPRASSPDTLIIDITWTSDAYYAH